MFNVSNVRNPGSIKIRDRIGIIELRILKFLTNKSSEHESKKTDRRIQGQRDPQSLSVKKMLSPSEN